MERDVLQGQSIVHYDGERLITTTDSYVTEFPLTIMVNRDEFATVICSPTHMEELDWLLASEALKLNLAKMIPMWI